MAVVVCVNVVSGGMRSVTLMQAFLFWLKLLALLTPVFFFVLSWASHGVPVTDRLRAADWVEPLTGQHSIYLTYSLILATFLGTMGLPHVVVRFYTTRDGRTARHTTLVVLRLLSCFYLLPIAYGVLGRVYAPDLVASGRADSVVLELPTRVFAGLPGTLLTAVLGAGAFAAFLSTCSGLVISVAGVVSQDLVRGRVEGVTAFRIGTGVAVAAASALTVASSGVAVAHAVELAFAVAASTFCPMLLLGIWWRGLTAAGVIAGLVVGGGLSTAAVLATTLGRQGSGWVGAILAQPAAVTVPLAFLTMVVGSLLSRDQLPRHLSQTMVRLHAPEHIELDRGPFHPERSTARR